MAWRGLRGRRVLRPRWLSTSSGGRALPGEVARIKNRAWARRAGLKCCTWSAWRSSRRILISILQTRAQFCASAVFLSRRRADSEPSRSSGWLWWSKACRHWLNLTPAFRDAFFGRPRLRDFRPEAVTGSHRASFVRARWRPSRTRARRSRACASILARSAGAFSRCMIAAAMASADLSQRRRLRAPARVRESRLRSKQSLCPSPWLPGS